MEKFEKPVDNSLNEDKKMVFPLENGFVLETYYDPQQDKTKRFFLKDKIGNIVEFRDSRNFKKENKAVFDSIKNQILNQGFILSDEELNKIANYIFESHFVDFDETIAVEN